MSEVYFRLAHPRLVNLFAIAMQVHVVVVERVDPVSSREPAKATVHERYVVSERPGGLLRSQAVTIAPHAGELQGLHDQGSAEQDSPDR